MPFEDFELYEGKKVSDLFKDIVRNSEQTKSQLEILITDLRPLVKTPADALTLTPIIRDYIESTIKNDDSLVKLAAISQRIMVNTSKSDDDGNGLLISDEEREELMKSLIKIEVSPEIVLKKPKSKIEIEKIEEK